VPLAISECVVVAQRAHCWVYGQS